MRTDTVVRGGRVYPRRARLTAERLGELAADNGEHLWIGSLLAVESLEQRAGDLLATTPAVDHLRYEGRAGTLELDDGTIVRVAIKCPSLAPTA